MEKTHYQDGRADLAAGSAADTASAPVAIGVDGGGTKTRVLLVSRDGTVLGHGVGGPGNALSVAASTLTDCLRAAIAAALPRALAGNVRAVAAGFAGASWLDTDDPGRRAAGQALRAALRDLGVPGDVPVDLRSDVQVAFAAAPGTPVTGSVLVGGTGAVAARLVDERVVATVDGHGPMLDDAGSGHWIGRQAARAVLRALDGRGPWTSLVPALTGRLLPEPLADLSLADRPARELARGTVVPLLIAAGLPALAELCPLVTSAADEGDEVAARILAAAVEHLVDTVSALSPRADEPLVTTGGLLGPGGALLAGLTARLAERGLRPTPVADGVVGAANLARRLMVDDPDRQ